MAEHRTARPIDAAMRWARRRSGLVALVVAAVLVTSVVAVVAVTADREEPWTPFDVAGKRVDTKADPIDPMKRPAGTKGVDLGEPEAPVDNGPGRDEIKPAQAKEQCAAPEPARGQDAAKGALSEVLAGLADAEEVCTSSETGQAEDLVDAPPLALAADAVAAPAPAPDTKGDRTEGSATETPTDAPTDAPTEDPGAEQPPTNDQPDEDAPTPTPTEGASGGGRTDDTVVGQAAGRVRPAAARGSPAELDRVLTPVPAVSRSRLVPASSSRRAAAAAVPPAGEYLSPNWVQAANATRPPALTYPAMAYDEARDQVVLFGGTLTAGGYSDQTWTWDGVTWTQRTPATSPTARTRATMAWDPVGQQVVMFGGQTASATPVNEVWAWDGTTWASVSTTGTPPSARTGASMAYDNVREAFAVFGGQTSTTTVVNDTWQLKNPGSGWAWTQIQAAGAPGAPPARMDHRLAYSASTSQLVLFGGATPPCATACSILGDTWTLGTGASSWTSQSPTHVPPARASHAMTFDPALGAVVMFGGADYSGSSLVLRGDTWAWTGADWSQAVGIAAPTGRAGSALASGPGGQVVQYGGHAGGASYLDETWSYNAALPVLGIDVERASDPSRPGDSIWTGDTIRIQITAANAGVDSIDASDQVSVVSALQEDVLAAGTDFRWGASGSLSTIGSCGSGVTAVCGLVENLTATIGNIQIPPAGLRVGEFLAAVTGGPKGCHLIDIPAIASSLLGGSAPVAKPITVCGGGLGLEDWWTYDTTDLGGGGSASVNVANGNLVVKQYDTEPVQAPGQLAIGLGRVYNSQDLMSAGGPIGAGWQFDVGGTGPTATGFGIAGLKLPNLQNVKRPLSMTYVDRDGTRHVFKLRSLGASIGNLSLPIDLTGQQGLLDSILGLLNPATLPYALSSIVEGLAYTNLCLDKAYTGPPGSNMFLFRYIGMGSNNCTTPAQSGELTLGWSLIHPNRMRYDFNQGGDLVRVTDPAGQQLVYDPSFQYGPTEIVTSSCETGAACPKVTINYDKTPLSTNRLVEVKDTAGRVTTYVVSRDLTLPLLREVWEPGNPYTTTAGARPSSAYTYASAGNPCAGSVGGTITSGQLCSVTDANGEKTTFSYVEAPAGPDRIAMVKDRRANASGGDAHGLATKYTWTDSTSRENPGTYLATADMAAPDDLASCGTTCHRIRYSDIDRWGRVGQIAEGTTGGTNPNDPGSGLYAAQTGYFWDGMGDAADGAGIASCSQPTVTMNHNLCQVIRRAEPTEEPFVPGEVGTGTVSGVAVHDHATDYLYGDFGQRLRERVLLDASQPWTDANSAITTWGSHEQYFDAGTGQRAFNNHVVGEGEVESSAGGGTYRQAVMQDNPMAYWRLDEASGTTMTSQTGTKHGVYGPGITYGAPGAVHGNAAVGERVAGWTGLVSPFNGFAHGTSASGSDFTVETWMKTANTGAEYAFQWGASSTAYASVGRVAGGLPFVALYSNLLAGESLVVYTPTSVADDEWHHVVYRYNGSGSASGVQIWIDGQQAPTVTYSDTLAGSFSTDLSAGTLGYSVNAGSTLDEVAVYPTTLSGARIEAHYSAARGATRVKADTLYAVVDEIQELSPRGNESANAGKWGEYLTSIRRDLPGDGVLSSTNKVAGSSVCGTAVRGNTGLVCEVDTPAAEGVSRGVCASPTSNLPVGSPTAPTPSPSYASSCTTYEYNDLGQRTLMRTPKANSASSAGSLKPATEYRYYPVVTTCTGEARKACDLSGSVSAGGWLKAVVDPDGEKIVYAYDVAGNVARTWDRNAAKGKDLTAAWADATAPPTTRFVDSVSANPVTSDALSVSNTALVAIAPDGTVTGAGTNASGELGDGSTTNRKTAVRADPMTNAVQVVQTATGTSSGCAATAYLTGGGEVWTTGAGAAGGGVSRPERRTGLPPDIISIAAGGCHLLALDSEGGLWAWGANGSGQIGNGSTASVGTPVKVLDDVSTMAGGNLSSLAVKTDGTTWAWGANSTGQLGLGDTAGRTTPTQVTSLKDAGIRQVSSGFGSSYAIGRDGTVWAFGGNASGELGDGTTTQRTSPVKVTTLGPGTAAGPVRQVVGANKSAIALLRDGTVRVWGINNAGQSGGGSAAATLPTPTQVPSLTGQVALAGGWATIATADHAGRIRVWGSTANNQRADDTNPATTATPAPAGIDISPYRSALWGVQGSRDATGNLVTTTMDRLGQPRRVRSGRGNDVLTSAYDRMTGYDAAGRPVTSTGAQHRSPGTVARTTYDAFGNPVKTIDARGVAARATFDALNRQLTSQVTRTPAAVAPGACTGTAAAADWTSAQNGHRICVTSTTYDGVGRVLTTTDANGQVTTTHSDAAGRQRRVDAPRTEGGSEMLTSRWNYDREGRVLDACSPRQFVAAEVGSTPNTAAGCAGTAVHATHFAYDSAGNTTKEVRYRAGGGSPEELATGYDYDADGNTTAVTDPNGNRTTTAYDWQGRRTSMEVPRRGTKTNTTRWRYDPNGNVTAVLAPGSINTGSGADGHLVVDGTTPSESTDGIAHGAGNPFQIPDGAQYRDVTLQNGAYVTSAAANGLLFYASGTVTVCATCSITVAGKGYQGGAAGSGGNGHAGDAANPNPGNGGKGGRGGLLGLSPSGGGGGGHKTDGGAAGTGGSGPGLPGLASGTPDFATVGVDYLLGSGGGGGGGGKALTGAGGTGGNGGGYLRLTAGRIVVNGTIDASGADGGSGTGQSAGAGGGAGGGIWLAAPTIELASPTVLDVTGGTGGTAVSNRNGGNGAEGYIRIDGEDVTNAPAGVEVTRGDMITAVSYDAANRPVDTIEGAQTVQADPALDASAYAAPDANGFENTRTRTAYDADGRVVAMLPPQAFSDVASLSAPNLNTARRLDYDLDGRPVAAYSPRYDNASGSPTASVGSGNDGGGSVDQQVTQCATGRVLDLALTGLSGSGAALPSAYGAQVGVCHTRTVYDPVGNVARAWLPSSSGGASAGDEGYLDYTYTDDGLVQEVDGPDPASGGRVVAATNVYDGVGRLVSSTDAKGSVTRTSYFADGLVKETEGQAYDPDGDEGPLPSQDERTQFVYDGAGNLVSTVNPEGKTTAQVWTSDNLLAQIEAPGPGGGQGTAKTRYGYDKVGNAIEVWQPEAVRHDRPPVRNEFTKDNLLAATHTPVGLTEPTAPEVPVTVYRSVRYDYAPAGMKTVTQTARCESDVPTACVPGYPKYSGAGFVKLNYGANGRLSSQEGRERASTETPTKSITTTYAQHGGPAQIKDESSGITINVGYYLDGSQRRVAESGVGAGGGGNVGNTNTYAYNGAGAVTVRTDRTGAAGVTGDETLTTSYRYNDAGLPAGMASQVLDPGSAGGVVTAYGWDQAGRLRSASTTTGSGLHRAEWSWHPNNALAGAKTTARISGADVVVGKYEYLYDKNRNVTKQIVTSDAGSGTGGYVNEYTYAPSEQLLSWDHQVTAGGGTAQETSYTWDKNSNRTSVTVDGVLASETSYNWDNSVAKVERPGKPDRVHAYNGFGLLTADGCNTYSYDAFDRVEKQVASGSTDCGSNGRTTTYDYDGLDRQRIVTVSSAAKPAANRATRSVFDGLSTSLVGQVGAVNGDNDGPSVLYQLDPGGAQTAYAQSGPGGASTGGSTAFLDTDGRGDVTAVTSFTTGSGAHALACAVRYDPFGTPVDAAPSGPSSHPDPASRGDGNGVCKTDSPAAEVTGNAVWYRGQVRDGSTGNYQLGVRTYDPGKAAFTTPDSYRVSSSATDLSVSVDPLTSNTYTYVNGNPINLIDPDGHGAVDGWGNDVSPCVSNPGSCSPTGAAKEQAAHKERVVREQDAWDADQKRAPMWCPSDGSPCGYVAGHGDKPSEPKYPNAVKESMLAACSFVPFFGLGCDSYDAGRTVKEDGVLSWQFGAAMVGFAPLGDVLKLPKQFDRILATSNDVDGGVKWVDEGGDLRAGRPSMSERAYGHQSGAPGARSNPATGRGMAPQLEMPGVDGSMVTARFDGVRGSEIIDRKLNPVFSAKAVAQAQRQAAVAAYNGYQAVWELPTPQAVAAANRFMDYAKISTIVIRQAP
ncbi:Kelch repeat-containing protein [Nocardioides sp. BYT-33-1]|uniref:Kelch repeat-containing protein n=1 Tax=Nocardioides sp. BYT-33-1 TaxID=3416952 RepID=UPI003F534C6C